jgi:hypothetical protein
MMDARTDSGGGGLCPMGACDLLTQDGCDTAMGQGCYFAAMMAGGDPMPLCAPAGTAGDGMPCMNVNDCQEGFICDGSDMICRHACCGGDSSACPFGQACMISIVDSMGRATGVGLCRASDTCDLLTQEGCMEPRGCYPSGDGVICIESTMDLMENAACTAANDCAPGFACAGMPSRCHAFCRLGGGMPACRMGQTCTGLSGAPAMVGVCTPPMDP